MKLKLPSKKQENIADEFQAAKKKKRRNKLIIAAIIIIVISLVLVRCYTKSKEMMKNMGSAYETATVTRDDISVYLSSSGTVKPLDSYSVTTLSGVEGTVLRADFEEGDTVKKGDVLYTISTDDLDTKIDSANKTLSRQEKSYRDALENYEKAKKDYSDYTVEAEKSGYVKELNIEAGDQIQAGQTAVASVYDNSTMKLYIPFNADDVSKKLVGRKASVELSNTGETLTGEVIKVNTYNETLGGSRVVRYVTISVKNPGGIAAGDMAAASIGDIDCNEEGTFSVQEESTIVSDITGEVVKIYVKEGQWIEQGDTVLKIASDTYESQLSTYEDQIENAKNSVEDAQDNLEEIINNKTDYVITSPITGTIITKNTKAGDTLNANAATTNALCTIYDLSAMTFQMMVDELDVMEVKEDQKVEITADAIPDEMFEGVVTNVSLESTTNGGVTQYPVTVRIDNPGSLLPGMNISGEILVEQKTDVLLIPTDCLMRGNQVYIQDESVTEADGEIPAGFRAVTVETGISDGTNIEIISGLSENDIIYKTKRESADLFNQMMTGPVVETGPADDSRGGPSEGGGPGGGR